MGFLHASEREQAVPVQDALWRADDSKLSVEQLTALSRAVPEDQERRDLALFLKVIHEPSQLVALSPSHLDEVPKTALLQINPLFDFSK